MTTTGAHFGAAADAGRLRVSDAERDRAVALLKDAYTEGRLEHSELDLRIGAVLAARNRSDLSAALRGLPTAGAVSTPRSTLGSTPGEAGRGRGAAAPHEAWRAFLSRPAGVAEPVRPASLERSWAMAAHWIGFLTLFVGPMVIACTKGKTSRYVREQAWEAANFHLTYAGANLLLGIATAVTFGITGFVFPLLALAWAGLTALAGLAAAAGNRFRYPWSLRIFG